MYLAQDLGGLGPTHAPYLLTRIPRSCCSGDSLDHLLLSLSYEALRSRMELRAATALDFLGQELHGSFRT